MRVRLLFITAFIGLFALVAPGAAEAHFIWIETDPAAQPGRSQAVLVYFGEPHEFLREESGGRLDQHDGLRAWLVDPHGERLEVVLKKELNRFVGAFTPRAVGRHNVLVTSLNHAVMDLTEYDRPIVKPLFYARTQSLVFEAGRNSEREKEISQFADLDIVPVTKALDPVRGSIVPRTGNEVVVRVVFKGRPLAKRRVNAFGPNGWVKELQATDSWGVTSFVPLWPGRYVLVVTNDEKTPGRFGDRTYDVVEHRATLSLLIGQSE